LLKVLASGVTSVHSGAAEILEHGINGMVVENPSNLKEIAENIYSLFDPAAREITGLHARILAENFTQGRNLEEMLVLYRGVIDSHKE
jgi:glycosyltransferase involved in cell wall biosynthesis